MADQFTGTIFRWLNAVMADPDLPPAAFKLAYAISQHINRSSLCAWPSQDTLAEAIGVKDARTIRRLAEALERRGYLLSRRRKQQSNVYRLAQDRTELSYQEEQTTIDQPPRPDENVRSSDQDRTFLASRPDILIPQDRTDLSYEPLKEPLIEPEGESARARSEFIPDDFKLTGDGHDWAVKRLGSADAVERSMERFRNHHRQVVGPSARSRDWQAKARNWIDDDANRQGRGVIQADDRLVDKVRSFDAGPDDDRREREWDQLLRMFARSGRWTRHVDQFGPAPGTVGCQAPRQLLIKHGIVKDDAA